MDVNQVGEGVSKKEIAKVVMANRGLLLSIIMKVERDRDAAEDILSLATERALRYGPGQFEGKASLLTYVRRIAHNTACEHARQSVVRKRVFSYEGEHRGLPRDGEEVSVLDRVADDVADVARAFEHKEYLEKVDGVLTLMRQRYPDAMKTWDLYRLEGLGYEDICDRLGIEPGAARGHVYRMSRTLEGLLASARAVAI